MQPHDHAFVVALDAAGEAPFERIGPKAANLAALARAGLPTPGGFCLTADAYRAQIAALGLEELVRRFAATADIIEQRRLAVEIRLALYEQPVAPNILSPLLAAWHAQCGEERPPAAVRSSALIEDRKGANFAGQFESFLGIDDEAAFLTAVRACWAALWTTNARRYMDNHGLSPADTAMAVLIQPLVDARASGGGLSETAEGQMLISATWGLGSAIAQGEVVPDRIVLSRQGFLRKIEAGRKDHRETCGHGTGTAPQAVPSELVERAVPRRRAGGHARPVDAQGARRVIGGRSRSNGRSTMPASSCCRRGRCTSSRARAGRDLAASIPGSTAIPPASAGAPAAPWWSTANASLRVSRPATCWSPGSPARRSATSCRASPAWWPSSAARPRTSPRSRASAASRWCSACSTPRSASPTARRCGRRRRRRRAVDARDAAAHFRHPAGREERHRAPAQGREREGQSGRQPDHPARRR